ncbi:hypothetical protein B0H67DRAFT_173626 [Lasiosphaeris hirsuta]|uniref:trimethyllysine dioxygenase n=1 Tax=Lasiosphaeris hirsuta TaxID=260670 RepID=A0AA40DXH3_9PEZI|nr:hypothetical protein B0H67DRAFT_173626 [Lasiosphaeris hirsuta]
MLMLATRDNCACAKCRNEDTNQRSFDTFDIDPDIRPAHAEGVGECLKITWSDQHESVFPVNTLDRYAFGDGEHETTAPSNLWGSVPGPSSMSYLSIDRDPKWMAKLTTLIKTNGFVFVCDTPYHSPEPTKQLLERIGPIRNTHYGGFYDFIPDLASADTAYTNLALAPHTDTTYFSDPAGLQAFHLLSHVPAPKIGGGETGADVEAASGGESILVDGFKASNILQREDYGSWLTLRSMAVRWHASGNEGIAVTPGQMRPVILVRGKKLIQIRWNNDDRGVVPLGNTWYKAARKWDQILKRENMQFKFQLKPGTVLIFNNWRVLHGRTAFTGTRRICGAYISMDDFTSRWRTSNFSKEEVLAQVMG